MKRPDEECAKKIIKIIFGNRGEVITNTKINSAISALYENNLIDTVPDQERGM